MKINVNSAAEIIKRHEVDPEKLRAIVEEMNLLVQPDVDEEKNPHEKKQFCVLVSDPDGKIQGGMVAWVLQIPENESVLTTQERIFKAVYEFNTTKKGRLMPAKTVGEALENVPAKHFKETGIWCKTKTPVLLLTTDNEIPKKAKE